MFLYPKVNLYRELILLMVLFQAGLTDIKERRIDNYCLLTGIAFLIPVLKAETVAAAVVVCMPLLLLRKHGMIGGGDIKLFFIILSAKGTEKGLVFIFIGFVIGGIYGLYKLLLCGQLRNRMKKLWIYIQSTNKERRYLSLEEIYEFTVPLAACMFFAELTEILIWSR